MLNRWLLLYLRRFTYISESLKIRPNNDVNLHIPNKYNHLQQIITPNIYRSKLVDLLDRYPYLTQKDSIELLKLLDALTDFHINLGDRQDLALKSFLYHLIDGNNSNKTKILVLSIYNKLINDTFFITRSIIHLFSYNLELNDQLELLRILNSVKDKASKEDYKEFLEDVDSLISNLFLSGKFEFIDNEVNFTESINLIYLIYRLNQSNDIVHYGLNKLLRLLDKNIDSMDRHSIINLIDMISHTFPSNYRIYLRRLSSKLVGYRQELSHEQLDQVKLALGDADYTHDYFNPS